MNYITSIIIKLLIILLSIIIAFLLYYTFVEKYILKPLCLLDSNTCLRVAYWNYKNSLLLHLEPLGYWVWFNGTKAFVYNVINDKVCKPGIDGTQYAPVYPLNPVPEATPENWICIDTVNSLINKYENEFKVKKQYLWKRINPKQTYKNGPFIKGPVSLSVYDILNIFADKNIINLKNI